jgi:predicted type IV restriction endonuclease
MENYLMNRKAEREAAAAAKKLPRNSSVMVIHTCKGARWRCAREIAALSGLSEENIARVIHNIQGSHQHRAKVESKKVGKDRQYRIFEKDKQVSLAELTTKLRPIIEGLKAEGKKSAARTSPATVARLAVLIERLLDEWAE